MLQLVEQSITIESKEGYKGVLVDSYGMYAEAFTPEMVLKIKEDLK